MSITNEDPNILTLELGDIIKFIAPNNQNINDKIFYINYIDKNKISFLNNVNNIIINIDENN